MTERWEYMVFDWSYVTRFKSDGSRGNSQEWRSELGIRKPGMDREERLHHDYGEEPVFSLLDVLNEFGAEGWELTTETVLATAAVVDTHGWSDAGLPIEMRWTLRRRIATS